MLTITYFPNLNLKYVNYIKGSFGVVINKHAVN
jgi:hypothetical protein